jgi:hypothetical protein
MSTLAQLTIDETDVASALFAVFKADATLQTALGGAGRIVTQDKAPSGLIPPRLHIEVKFCTPDPYTHSYRCMVDLRSVVANVDKSQHADNVKHKAIMDAVRALIPGHGNFDSSGLRFQDSWIEVQTGTLRDRDDPENSYRVATMVARVRDKA